MKFLEEIKEFSKGSLKDIWTNSWWNFWSNPCTISWNNSLRNFEAIASQLSELISVKNSRNPWRKFRNEMLTEVQNLCVAMIFLQRLEKSCRWFYNSQEGGTKITQYEDGDFTFLTFKFSILIIHIREQISGCYVHKKSQSDGNS